MKSLRYLLLSMGWLLSFTCNRAEIIDSATEVPAITVKYQESFADFPNPERGFYRYSETRASSYSPLSESDLRKQRGLTGEAYKSYNTLVFRYFVLDEFVDSPISESFLAAMDRDFAVARNAGVKMIPRFCYTTRAKAGDCPEGFICPPYGDAPKARVLAHINQVAPIINKNEDVILCIQMGFIGTWGENYYTDYFGDASPNDTQGKVLDENWVDRVAVLNAMLEAFSENLMIQVRYPQFKQRAIYGIDALTNVAALTESEAFSGTNKARIGFHNDCLFASPDDYGTYEDYGNSNSPRKMDLTNLKPYFQEDSQYVLVGGETCSDGYSPQNDCSPEGMADIALRALHYTYLNADYNNEVNNDWVAGGCMDSILIHLGYRFVLQEATFQEEMTEDRNFNFRLRLKNVGYAGISKDRPVHLVLKNAATGSIYTYKLNTDIRKWVNGVTIEESVALEEDLESGDYQCYLHLPDRFEAIRNRSEFAIQLGNIGIWEQETGYNKLGYTLSIP